MKGTPYAVGLDIGTTKIVAVVGKLNQHNKVEALGIGRAKSNGVKRGVVTNISQTIDSIKEAIGQAEANSGLKIKRVMVGIAGQHIRSMQHSDYIIRHDPESIINVEDLELLKQNVDKMSMSPGEQILHALPQEYKVDSESNITDPEGMYGGRLEANFHIVVGQITSIRNIVRCVQMSELEMGDITLEPLASSASVLSSDEKEAGVALVDIGGGTTDIAIFKNGIIRHTAVIPYGGNVITDDITSGCEIITKQAETLKVKFGSAWPGENKEYEIVSIPGLRGRPEKEISLKLLSQIIHSRVSEIIESVKIEIKNYEQDDPKKKLICGIVLTGGGSQLKHISQLVQYLTGMPTRIGYPNEHLAGGSSIKELQSPVYATSVGLLKLALDHLDQPMAIDPNEIIPEDIPEPEPEATEQEPEATKEESKGPWTKGLLDKIWSAISQDSNLE